MSELFHDGERAVQARAGVSDAALQTGRMIRERLFAGAHAFIESQPMVLCASVDRHGDAWPSIIQGRPGFIRVADERTLVITPDPAHQDNQDPLWRNIDGDNRIGLLLIDLASRRRLRVNGTVSRAQPDTLTVSVQSCYPNCPKYIQRRHTAGDWIESPRQSAREGRLLTAQLAHALRATDTLFVASVHPHGGADVSHRGGRPGFVHVIDSATLRIPDYAGNNLFNTLGNFHANPRAGILVPDFRSGRVTQIIGRPQIEWDTHHPQQSSGGTQRYWRLHIARWRLATLPVHLDWRFIDNSPHLPGDDI